MLRVRHTVAAFVLLATSFADAMASGGSSTHSGDLFVDQNNPWFIGATSVPYCVVASPEYQADFSTDALQELVREAFADWREFFARYKINEIRQDLNKFRLPTPVLTQDFRDVGDCSQITKGLRIYFGIDGLNVDRTDPNVASALGWASRGTYDHRTFFNDGAIYLKHWTGRRELVKHLLLHELGHVFGMPHDSVYVMDEFAGEQVKRRSVYDSPLIDNYIASPPDEIDDPAFGHIESPAWRYKLREGDALDLSYRDRCFMDDTGGPTSYVRGYRSHLEIPEWIQHAAKLPQVALLKFRARDCYKIILEIHADHSMLGPNTDVELKLVNGVGETFVVPGHLTDASYKQMSYVMDPVAIGGPVVYTTAADGQPTRFRFDYTSHMLPAFGTLTFGQQQVPLFFDYERGPFLSIGLPTGTWLLYAPTDLGI